MKIVLEEVGVMANEGLEAVQLAVIEATCVIDLDDETDPLGILDGVEDADADADNEIDLDGEAEIVDVFDGDNDADSEIETDGETGFGEQETRDRKKH